MSWIKVFVVILGAIIAIFIDKNVDENISIWIFLGKSLWIIGTVKAMVFPIPVCVATITSLPCKIVGIAFTWIAVGELYNLFY